MAAKYQQEVQGYPLAPSSVVPRSDEEHATNYQSDEQLKKKKKRMKCFAYIAVFAVFQIIVILVFALTVMRVRTPKVRLGDIAVANDSNGNVRLSARVLVRNRNFGHYKFDGSVATVRSGSNVVGQFVINEARARARSTKRIAVAVELTSSNANSGSLDLSVEARLRGKVELMRVIRRRKSADMNCTMTVSLATNAVQNLRCE